MVAPVPQQLPALEASDPPTEFLDPTTVTECVEIPTAIPAAIRDKIFPPEQLSLTKFIDFPLPLCILSESNLDKYFAPLPPDITLVSDLVVALKTLPLPRPVVIHRLSHQAASMWTNGSRSLTYPHTNDPRRFPFWILPFWRAISEFRSSQFSWRAVEGYLSHLPPGNREAATFRAHMDALAWSGTVMADRLKDWTPVQELRQFASRDWLSGSNLNVMLNVMYEQIRVVNPAVELEYKIQSTYFCVLLRAARKSHLQGQEYYSGGSSLQSVGTLLANQPHKICFLSHVQGNHWTAIAIDAVQLRISYGDSMQQAVPDDLKDAIKWWLALYFTSPFAWEPLAITAQIDSYSCGLLAANSLMHYIDPNTHPLLLPHPADLDVSRLHWGNMVINSHQMKDGNKCTPTANKSTTELTPSLVGRKPGGEMIPQISSRSLSLHHKPSNKQPGALEPPKKRQKTLNTPIVGEEETFDGELVDICRAEKKSAGGKTQGRPRTSLLDKVTQQCHPPGDPKRLRYRCIGRNCRYSLAAPANRRRILKHATSCHRLPSALRREVNTLLADESPGALLEVLEGSSGSGGEATQSQETKKTMMEVEFGKAGRTLLKLRLDHAVVKLLCAAALPPTLVDYPEWKDIFSIANTAYKPACSTVIADAHIPTEAARVRSLTLKFLSTQHHLTISFDGGTTKRPRSVYTVHFTTADGRSFLIEGEDSSDTSHTGEYLAQMLLKAMDLVGHHRFSGITSDNTGNTRLARQLVSQEVRTCIPMSDVCHHLNLLAKDIAKLDMFSEMIKDLRAVITLFRKSSHAAEALEAVRHRLGISRGLEGIGKTRFATICTAAMSLQRCLPALRELVGNSFKFPAKKAALANLFQPGSIVGLTFEISLNRFTQVGAPIAKSIVCLESTQTNPADVYKYWIAICGSIKQVLNNPTNGFSSNDASEIYRVVNARFREQLQDGPADCYLAAIALEPRKSLCYIQTAFLQSCPNLNPLVITIKVPPLTSDTKGSDHNNWMQSLTCTRVLGYLKQLLEYEWRSQHNPILKKLTATEVRLAFIRQFERYVKGVYPFETTIGEKQSALSYWRNLTLNGDSAVLACIGEKLFSIKPNSMPEERTMSVFTRMNSTARNRQQVRALVDMTQIRQWHMYDPERHAGTREHPTVSFYDLDSLLKPQLNKGASKPTITSHKTDGSYLVAEDADGLEELGEEDMESWLDETDCVQIDQKRESCFNMECDIDLRAAVVTQVLEEARGLDSGKELDEKASCDAEEVDDPDSAWDW